VAKNPSESLLARLKNMAREQGLTMEMAMRRYAHERLLSLMQATGRSDEFCLKGGVMLGALLGEASRPTEDIDFNGMDAGMSVSHLEEALRDVCSAHDGGDGLTFDLTTMRVLKDRDGAVPGGKVFMMANIGRTRVPLRIDVGYGNAITPRTVKLEIESILPSLIPPITVTAYPLETTVAEKLHAMHRHGELNTRIKDYFDLWQLSLRFSFEGEVMAEAIANTFAQQGDEVPEEMPALGPGFAESKAAQRQWDSFAKLVETGRGEELSHVVGLVAGFVMPALGAARGGASPGDWRPGEGWSGAVPRPFP